MLGGRKSYIDGFGGLRRRERSKRAKELARNVSPRDTDATLCLHPPCSERALWRDVSVPDNLITSQHSAQPSKAPPSSAPSFAPSSASPLSLRLHKSYLSPGAPQPLFPSPKVTPFEDTKYSLFASGRLAAFKTMLLHFPTLIAFYVKHTFSH